MLSKRSVLRIIVSLFSLLKLFSSHIYCITVSYWFYCQQKLVYESLQKRTFAHFIMRAPVVDKFFVY